MNNQEVTEVEYKPEDSPEKQLVDFKKTMREFKRQEEVAAKLVAEGKKFTSATVHFGDVNPDELTQEDMEMWEVVKTNLITSKSKDDEHNRIPADTLFGILEEYRKKVRMANNVSRSDFAGFISNKLSPMIGRESVRRLKNY